MSSPPTVSAAAARVPAHPLADLYIFDWSEFSLRLPLVSTIAVALCLFTGVAFGHPGGALIAGGGAFTIGFGANQRIQDSRVLPMLLAVFATSTATFAGTMVGYHGFAIVLASTISAGIYGVLTIRRAEVSWVGQQASVALFIASAFPVSLRGACIRAGLILAGGMVQTVITTAGLRLIPELRRGLSVLPRVLFESVGRPLVGSVAELSARKPLADGRAAFVYSLRLMLTVALATEFYRRLGLQSGYWTPMTALLVQKPAFSETVQRALLRVLGTLAGASLATVLVMHLHMSTEATNWTLAALTSLFALLSFATNPVNYGLFALCLTSYIVFLLSLNQIPGPEIAHRRALCTAAGAVIALIIHLDALRCCRKDPTKT
jgi:hypothetical protein